MITFQKIQVLDTMRSWTSLVLAVCIKCGVSHPLLLGKMVRSPRVVLEARTLLTWAFLEISDAPEAASIAWLEQMVGVSRRTLQRMLERNAPEALDQVLELAKELSDIMTPKDVQEAITAGIMGTRIERSHFWSRSFLSRLGINSDSWKEPDDIPTDITADTSDDI